MPRPIEPPAEAAARTVEAPEGKLLYAFKVNDIRYELHGQWGWKAANLVRQLTGMGVPRILAEMRDGNGDIELLGHLIYLSLREAGDTKVTFDEAHDLIAWDDTVVTPEIGTLDADYETADPEPDEDPAPEG